MSGAGCVVRCSDEADVEARHQETARRREGALSGAASRGFRFPSPKPRSKSPISTDSPASKSFARHLPAIARVLLGLMFLVFGLNGFLNFIPQPKDPIPEGAMAFAGAMMKTGYLFQLVKGTEVVVGALLLVNRFVPLALVILAPVLVNIVAFHVFLAPSGLGLLAVIVALDLYLAWAYRSAFRALLAARVAPG
jgi:uncharacterized membrane protein YphA (DoxX/SURF4 family)